MIAQNPILPGFYPDPSICAVGEDYYIVNSTFAYFPGLPIFHSKDLVHWEQIGHAMESRSQLKLAGCGQSHGLFAPTLRYHDGRYYVICTNVSGGGNFIVTAKDPEGPWSEPIMLGPEAEGIDPSLFFDEDGTCYYIGTRTNPYGEKYDGDNYIWIQKLNVDDMQLEGEPYFVWNGALRDVAWPEGPHLYKKDGYYYIMYAEGGTGPHHSVCIIRSKTITGPYENNFCNPIITHRHLGKAYPIQCVGHSDMIQAANGEWYMVMLATRPKEGFTNLGRETFLAKVTWEDGWPVVNAGVGILTDEVKVNLPEWRPESDEDSYVSRQEIAFTQPCMDKHYDFTKMAQRYEKLGFEFVQLREPDDHMYELNGTSKALRMYPSKDTLTDQGNVSYLGIRQSHHKCEITVRIDASHVRKNDQTGLVLMQSNEYLLKAELCEDTIAVIKVCKEQIQKLAESTLLDKNDITVKMTLCDEQAKVSVNGQTMIDNIDIHELSTEIAGGFVGCTVGMYMVSEQPNKASYVDFLTFDYEEIRNIDG